MGTSSSGGADGNFSGGNNSGGEEYGGSSNRIPSNKKRVAGSNTRYYGGDGFIYNVIDGSRVRGNPPAEKKAPAPKSVSSGYSKPKSKPKSKPEAPEPAAPEPTQEQKRAEITKTAAGLESTISPGAATPDPVRNVSYLTGNTQSQTVSRFLKKKEATNRRSLFG